MKILLDVIYTNRPSVCSTSYLAWEIIEHLVAARDDVFFYLPVPEHYRDDPVEVAFWSRLPERVKPILTRQYDRDRMWELFRFPEWLQEMLAPGNTKLWDIDVVISSRIPQLLNMRVNSGRPQGFLKGSYRAIYGLEEMPLFSFRKTVGWGSTGETDLHSLAAYEASNGLVVNNLWTKQNVLQLARQWLSPSRVLSLGQKIHEAVPVPLERLGLRPKKAWPKKGEPLNVVFTGRVTGTRNFAEVAELFRKQFSFAIGKQHVRFVISTNSSSFGVAKTGEVDFIEVQHNSREEFYKFLRETAHVAVNLSTVEDFSLSTYEPLLHGVPVIVANEPWSGFLGSDYPFRVDNLIQAYAVINQFIAGYGEQYQRLAAWEQGTWAKTVAGPLNVSSATHLARLIAEHESAVAVKIEAGQVGKSYRTFIETLSASDLQAVDLRRYVEDNEMVFSKEDWSGVPLARRSNLHVLKLIARQLGWRDLLEPGLVTRQETI